MAFSFSAWQPKYLWNGQRADDGLVKDGFAKFGSRLDELVTALNSGAFGGSGTSGGGTTTPTTPPAPTTTSLGAKASLSQGQSWAFSSAANPVTVSMTFPASNPTAEQWVFLTSASGNVAVLRISTTGGMSVEKYDAAGGRSGAGVQTAGGENVKGTTLTVAIDGTSVTFTDPGVVFNGYVNTATLDVNVPITGLQIGSNTDTTWALTNLSATGQSTTSGGSTGTTTTTGGTASTVDLTTGIA